MVSIYHADLPDDTKQQQLEAFTTQKRMILVATSAIGAGFDFDNIGLVIHLYGAWSISDFIQGSGRLARRPQSKGISKIILDSNHTLPNGSNTLTSELEGIYEFIREGYCRRRVIHKYFNNRAVDSCQLGEEPCDLCEQRSKDLAEQSQIARFYSRASQENYQKLIEMVSFWLNRGSCLMHFIYARGEWIYLSICYLY